MSLRGHFSPELFRFLKDLRGHNNRAWFQANRERYESAVRDPFLRFISDFGPRLCKISRHFVADPRPTGGSLFRIYHDTRFSKDKSPYKTNAAADFRHRAGGRDAHAPGFYLSLEPGGCVAAAGLWHPDPPALGKVRGAIVARPKEWERIRRLGLEVEGDSLVRPPKGYDPAHPFIGDIKHKDFYTTVPFTEKQVCNPRFLFDFTVACKKMSPLTEFLAEALGMRW
ncbi:MAG TPA: TIGR02453 family protein [Thermoanaerobaculia bacterium]|nr:TIGR02453 family protein [Thermoanaerobaculia bacterium]